MVVGALAPPDAARGATVYTNAPKQRREAISADLCTLPWPPTAARATGRGHGSRDIDGPMVPVLPWGSDLRPRHQGGDATTHTNSRTWHHLIWEIWAGSSA